MNPQMVKPNPIATTTLMMINGTSVSNSFALKNVSIAYLFNSGVNDSSIANDTTNIISHTTFFF